MAKKQTRKSRPQVKPQVPIIFREMTAWEVRRHLVCGINFYIGRNWPPPSHDRRGLRRVTPSRLMGVHASVIASLTPKQLSYVFDTDTIRDLKKMAKNRYRNTVATVQRGELRFYVRDDVTEWKIATQMHGQLQALTDIPDLDDDVAG